MVKEHIYKLQINWTGNNGTGTSDSSEYERSHTISVKNKIDILASSDAPFRGDISKHNPEDFLLASISSCHMLWFLHLCADNGVVVTAYTDNPVGTMIQNNNGGGNFKEVILYPIVTTEIEIGVDKLNELHQKANSLCFIANSLNFKVQHQPVYKVKH